ncbi:hypothetical protein HOLleu_44137 [Holothuria leucospilota]|uniref:CCHC-type domain-containing protein n=1 Tax=Holothuria leucospilota TaxID=206669 RepID=A0A9Q0YDM8_HOLLE|nr:hypothetical protein HOLleu_44137 [Holothuria leucospilota]
MGLDSCSSLYSCVWCKCSASDRWDSSKSWSMTNPDQGARTVSEICEMAGRKRNKYNCSFPPIFTCIPVDHVVMDSLHLFLRIADQLVSQLIKYLRLMDNIKSMSVYSPLKHLRMAKFETFVNSLGIEWNFYVDKSSKEIKSRDFTGPEHWKVFNSINLRELIPEHQDVSSICELWQKFIQLMTFLKKLSYTSSEIDQFEVDAKLWVQLFMKVYLKKDITPYMHVLQFHVAETLRLHGNVSFFSQQGLEKLNDIVTKWYFRSSNFRGKESLKQVMMKQNRMNYLRPSCSRVKTLTVKCKQCGTDGHNKRSCADGPSGSEP